MLPLMQSVEAVAQGYKTMNTKAVLEKYVLADNMTPKRNRNLVRAREGATKARESTARNEMMLNPYLEGASRRLRHILKLIGLEADRSLVQH